MPNVIHRTARDSEGALRQRTSMHVPGAEWLINPTFEQVQGVPPKYWKVDADTVVEMTPAEKVSADASLQQVRKSKQKQHIERSLSLGGLATGLTQTVSTSGLEIHVSIGDLIVADVTVLTADPVHEKSVRAFLVRREATPVPTYFVLVLELTDGLFATLKANETSLATLGSWTIAPNGTELVEV